MFSECEIEFMFSLIQSSVCVFHFEHAGCDICSMACRRCSLIKGDVERFIPYCIVYRGQILNKFSGLDCVNGKGSNVSKLTFLAVTDAFYSDSIIWSLQVILFITCFM